MWFMACLHGGMVHFCLIQGRLPSTSRITIPIDLEMVIMEGSRRLKESETLQEELA